MLPRMSSVESTVPTFGVSSVFLYGRGSVPCTPPVMSPVPARAGVRKDDDVVLRAQVALAQLRRRRSRCTAP